MNGEKKPTRPRSDKESKVAGTDSTFAASIAKGLQQTQEKALGLADARHVPVMQIAYIIGAIGILGGLWLIYKDSPGLGTIVIIVGIAGCVLGMFFTRPRQLSLPDSTAGDVLQGAGARRPPVKSSWSLLAPRLPLPIHVVENDLSGRLSQIRQQAQAKYKSMLKARTSVANIDPDRVRINVFLPDLSNGTPAKICELSIPEGLHHGMRNDRERAVRFRPSEGLTGRVFTLRKSFGAARESSEAPWTLVLLGEVGGLGDQKFTLTVEQIELIDPALRWIVSYPLNANFGEGLQTFGVLNVDGFVEPLTHEEMQELFVQLKDAVDRFAIEFGRLAKSRITITTEDV